jgi:lysophospholipase L1-like esterase
MAGLHTSALPALVKLTRFTGENSMATQWLRRAWLLAASALLLAACGGGTIVSKLEPTRVVNFGDGMGDLGNNSTGARYTVNDGSNNNWTQYVASGYGRALTARSAGGLAFAVGNARITAKPDAAGSSTTPTVKEQVDAFLAADHPAGNDLILVSAGTSDMIVELRGVLDGTQSEDQARANLQAAARDFGAQIRRLVEAGAKHVVAIGPLQPRPLGVGPPDRPGRPHGEDQHALHRRLADLHRGPRRQRPVRGLRADVQPRHGQSGRREPGQRGRRVLHHGGSGSRHRHRRQPGELPAVHRRPRWWPEATTRATCSRTASIPRPAATSCSASSRWAASASAGKH